MPVERIKAIIPSDGLEKDIVVRKAIDLVKSAAVSGKDDAEEKPVKEEKAPAKKPAEKKETAEKKPAAKKAPAKKPAPKKAE